MYLTAVEKKKPSYDGRCGQFNDNDFEEDVTAGGYADDAGNCDNGMALEMIGVVRLTPPPLSRSPTPRTAGEGA